MRRFVAATAAGVAFAAVANANPSLGAGTASGNLSVSITLRARVVSSTWVELSGRDGTDLSSDDDDDGRDADLGTVDSEGHSDRHGHAVERRDDRGAFHVADVSAKVGFTHGGHGSLMVSAGDDVSYAAGLGYRFSCGDLADAAYANATSAAAPGTTALTGQEARCASHLAEGDEVNLALAMHVGDETPSGEYAATYVVTAVPDII